MTYHLQVDADPGPIVVGDREKSNYRNLYRGTSIPDAMAAWSKAIADGEEYVMLEALRELPKADPLDSDDAQLRGR